MTLLYLLDANTLIDANRDYYGINQVKEYWDWLIYLGEKSKVKIPIEIYEEIIEGKSDILTLWAKRIQTKNALLLDEEVDISHVREVTSLGYAMDLNDIEVENLGKDPFLIAYAMADPGNRILVTTENSRPSAKRQNKKIPDVAKKFNIRVINPFKFGHDLGFRTDWYHQIN